MSDLPASIHQRHDFTAKLRQESVLPMISSYIAWQKAVREAFIAGQEPPALPSKFGPLSINLDLTTACNYRCDHCIDWDILNSRAKYQHQKLLLSLESMIRQGLRSVILIGGGEPTLYPGFGDVVSFLKKQKVQVAVVSNGSRNKAIYDTAHFFTRKDWVRLSLDSGTNETFQRMHKPVRNISLEEICSSVPKIRERNPDLQIGFSFIITWQGATRGKEVEVVPNIDEIVTATKLAREHQFNYISFKPFLTRFENGGEVLDAEAIVEFKNTLVAIRGAIHTAKEFETPSFQVLESINLKVLESESFEEWKRQPNMCHMQALRQVLSPLGLFNCPAHRGVAKARIASPEAYSSEGHTKETQASTATILGNFNAEKECREVTCIYNPTNWWLENAIQGNIPQENLEALPDQGDYFL
ncbi:MAG: radical SAM protein [Patescibacteria group bacterium]|mgnify:CR=1 FL=1